MNTTRNEIKARIVGAGLTMQETLDRLHRQYGWSDSASNFSNKLQRNSLRYREVVELADVIGYELKWVPRERGMRMTNADIDRMPYTLNAQQVAEILGIAKNSAYTLMHSEGFPTLHIGRRLVVPKEKLLQWMDDQLE